MDALETDDNYLYNYTTDQLRPYVQYARTIWESIEPDDGVSREVHHIAYLEAAWEIFLGEHYEDKDELVLFNDFQYEQLENKDTFLRRLLENRNNGVVSAWLLANRIEGYTNDAYYIDEIINITEYQLSELEFQNKLRPVIDNVIRWIEAALETNSITYTRGLNFVTLVATSLLSVSAYNQSRNISLRYQG